jgi:hypothetical protein
MSKPTGLPEVAGLPDVPETQEKENPINKGRRCPQCKKEARVVSNRSGVQAYCGPCKIDWPISSAARGAEVPLSAPRGLRKETIVEPDWDKAYD